MGANQVKTVLLRWSICNECGEQEPDREADARGERYVYESARQALSATVKVDEVKDLLDRSAALVEYARRAKDAKPIARATEPRLYAVRRLRTAEIATPMAS